MSASISLGSSGGPLEITSSSSWVSSAPDGSIWRTTLRTIWKSEREGRRGLGKPSRKTLKGGRSQRVVQWVRAVAPGALPCGQGQGRPLIPMVGWGARTGQSQKAWNLWGSQRGSGTSGSDAVTSISSPWGPFCLQVCDGRLHCLPCTTVSP